MKVTVKAYHAVAAWKWDTSSESHKLFKFASPDNDGYEDEDDEDDDEVCGICRQAFEGCCPDCKVPGDDCPLIWGECSHVFHMHCLLKWIDTESSKQQCPLDRRPWATADRKPDKLPTTVDGNPMPTLNPGPLDTSLRSEEDPFVRTRRHGSREMELTAEGSRTEQS
ncbi:putative ubiquitin-protein ligase [Papiliotrema laurentii]|uniref:Anaphase-promoting complex subunit 11 n=1 Tax=Papiliotrema laurentii TaxID=5418 RepID=A0AAD9CY38_PAPLA|nr:putative ubiquitin-protein ligase [Papiliotrema laurentii]